MFRLASPLRNAFRNNIGQKLLPVTVKAMGDRLFGILSREKPVAEADKIFSGDLKNHSPAPGTTSDYNGFKKSLEELLSEKGLPSGTYLKNEQTLIDGPYMANKIALVDKDGKPIPNVPMQTGVLRAGEEAGDYRFVERWKFAENISLEEAVAKAKETSITETNTLGTGTPQCK